MVYEYIVNHDGNIQPVTHWLDGALHCVLIHVTDIVQLSQNRGRMLSYSNAQYISERHNPLPLDPILPRAMPAIARSFR